ncbi:MAG TPA: XdhC family protein [Steroidobacteraceae bacterium]|nr:XdhC family protein [Steroidobacteraceae bacterium]
MNYSGVPLADFFRTRRDRREPLVLATVTRTLGSTYRKAGAQMLIAGDGSAAGLLSGGCLESDLMERARAVLAGAPLVVDYDTRSSDDLIWGIGLGCEGAMSILMVRLDTANDYQPFAFIDDCRRRSVHGNFALVAQSSNPTYPLGAAFRSDCAAALPTGVDELLRATTGLRAATTVETSGATFLITPVELAPRLLVLGAGPDVMPLVDLAGLMGWHVTVLDHRPAYAVAERFPRAQRVVLNPAAELARELRESRYDAAVVMSHHLLSDQAYLAALAEHRAIPYVGLLGPAPRRARLMQELGDQSQLLEGRLRGPIGLDIGAKTPETIALAIVSEIQAVLAGRPGGSFASHS